MKPGYGCVGHVHCGLCVTLLQMYGKVQGLVRQHFSAFTDLVAMRGTWTGRVGGVLSKYGIGLLQVPPDGDCGIWVALVARAIDLGGMASFNGNTPTAMRLEVAGYLQALLAAGDPMAVEMDRAGTVVGGYVRPVGLGQWPLTCFPCAGSVAEIAGPGRHVDITWFNALSRLAGIRIMVLDLDARVASGFNFTAMNHDGKVVPLLTAMLVDCTENLNGSETGSPAPVLPIVHCQNHYCIASLPSTGMTLMAVHPSSGTGSQTSYLVLPPEDGLSSDGTGSISMPGGCCWMACLARGHNSADAVG